jgi:hypothetical protein
LETKLKKRYQHRKIKGFSTPPPSPQPSSLKEVIIRALDEHLFFHKHDGLSLFVFVAYDYKLRVFPISAVDEKTARHIAANAHNIPELSSESAWKLVYQYPKPGDAQLSS